MRKVLPSLAFLFTIGGLACVAPGVPVPVVGNAQALVGEWVGEYSSPETGRVGSITFTLQAGRDSAKGDVLMIPASADVPRAAVEAREGDPTQRAPRVLTITFVACADREVTGRLDPYLDPQSGEKVFTTFDGVLKGDKLSGTFVSYYEVSGRRATGKWVVKRRKL